MSTTEAAFYDVAMVEPGSPALLPLEESTWAPLYLEAVSWIHPAHAVVDLGCGTGRFGDALWASQHYAHYTGVDFSGAALNEAGRYLDANGHKDYTLEQGDLRDWQPASDRAGNTVYTCLETLEHLEDDVDLVRRVPPGHSFVFSVPNYDSAAHLRTFRNARDVWGRYDDLLTFRRWSLVELGGPRSCVHLCDTVRRADSW